MATFNTLSSHKQRVQIRREGRSGWGCGRATEWNGYGCQRDEPATTRRQIQWVEDSSCYEFKDLYRILFCNVAENGLEEGMEKDNKKLIFLDIIRPETDSVCLASLPWWWWCNFPSVCWWILNFFRVVTEAPRSWRQFRSPFTTTIAKKANSNFVAQKLYYRQLCVISPLLFYFSSRINSSLICLSRLLLLLILRIQVPQSGFQL